MSGETDDDWINPPGPWNDDDTDDNSWYLRFSSTPTTTPTTSVTLPPQEARTDALIPYGLIALFLGLFLLVFGVRNYRRNGTPPANPLAQKMARDPVLYANDDLGDEDEFLGDKHTGDRRV